MHTNKPYYLAPFEIHSKAVRRFLYRTGYVGVKDVGKSWLCVHPFPPFFETISTLYSSRVGGSETALETENWPIHFSRHFYCQLRIATLNKCMYFEWTLPAPPISPSLPVSPLRQFYPYSSYTPPLPRVLGVVDQIPGIFVCMRLSRTFTEHSSRLTLSFLHVYINQLGPVFYSGEIINPSFCQQHAFCMHCCFFFLPFCQRLD